MDIYQTRCDNMSYHDARGFEDRRQAMVLYRQTEDSTYNQLAKLPEQERRRLARRAAEDTVAGAYYGLRFGEAAH